MERFGSSKLRIAFVCFALLLVGLVLGGVRPGEGGDMLVFGAPIALSSLTLMVDPAAVFRGALIDLIYTVVPATFLFSAVFPLFDVQRKGTLKDLVSTLGLGILNGLFYSQVLLLPIWAASFRLVHATFPGALCLADLNAVVLGIQLLLWAGVLGRLLKSNPGLSIVLVFALKALGKYMAWGGEYLGDPDLVSLPPFVVKGMVWMGKLLPTGQVPSDPFMWSALPLSIGVPFLLLLALALIPAKKGRG